MSADWEKSTASPSTDPINPQANEWINRDESGRPSATAKAASTPGTSRTALHVQSARVQDLARRLSVNAEALASKISPDLIRRLKYPVHVVQNEDGTRTYLEDRGIVEGLQSGRGTDIADGPVAVPVARDASGRYTK